MSLSPRRVDLHLRRNFSESNVNNIETEKSRIVLHELEKNWWILASVDLTRLPSSRRPSQDSGVGQDVEFSAREVSPAPLLVTQLVQAHALFLLHHATSLSDFVGRIGRDTFCGFLDRYWTAFCKNWDVLLHGNPASNIYNATKLSGGGELGIGVGEEEWGSGEREVLEGFIDRTEGLCDLIVGRYGLPPASDRPTATVRNTNQWLGTGNDPAAADGLVFSGKGLLSKRSLCTVSQWMEAIFKLGEAAYGVGENPTARLRQRRNRPKTDRASSSESAKEQEIHPKAGSVKKKNKSLRKQAMENNAAPSGIPAPLVGQAERSLDQATAKVDSSVKVENGKLKPSPLRNGSISESKNATVSTTDNMLKYLTLGYGSAWTLNPKGLKSAKLPDDKENRDTVPQAGDPGLQEVDPTPHVSEDEEPFVQKLEQSMGKFLIGLSGDLEQAEMDSDDNVESDISSSASSDNRLFHRILNIELAHPRQQRPNTTIRANSKESAVSANSNSSKKGGSEAPKTSAAASIDGPQPNISNAKVQVAVYVHQPFIFVFMFELHTPTLTMPAFYKGIHSQLGPLQKPLLKSTDPTRTAARIAEAIGEKSASSSSGENVQPDNPIYDLVFDPTKLTVRTSIPNVPVPGSLAAEGLTQKSNSFLSISGSWYTLGIPIGTASDENPSNLVKSSWSRTEALNAHTQILNTFLATRSEREFEHTVKTARGWWVIWMKVLFLNKRKTSKVEPSMTDSASTHASINSGSTTTQPFQPKEAFLVRKAADFRPNLSLQTRTISTGPGKWLLREQKRDVSGASAMGTAASAKGVSDGVGVDAQKWVEGLLTLTR